MATPCPIVTDDVSEMAAPSPDTLAYSFTLPVGAASCRVARAATRVVLEAHGLEGLTDAAVQVVSELAACACRFTPGEEVYVSLRYREDALRVNLYDGHPRHRHPRVAEACEVRRRAALRVLGCWGAGVLGCVVRECEGEWGFGEGREPGGGTRM
ncbi:ATP-binding protein [Streptomyces sp. NPDC001833]|uniref:ATP-binding protein n=1 Tax=Streptomyces sp. NPDC001833 TaxID=3154658 RepID=UPI00331AE8D0